MKKKNKTRLINLARHLGDLHLKELLTNKNKAYANSKGDNRIDCFYWALKEFPKVFPEWQFDDSGAPFLNGHGDMNSLTAAAYFLNLDMDTMFHLFVGGYQMPEQYFGKHLGAEANPGDLSNNIYEYLRYIETQEDSSLFDRAMQTILLTPIKNNHYERNKNQLSKMCA